MKYLRQLLIIILFSFIGEIINFLLPFSIPASIYGMILLFVALCTKVVKLEQIEETGEYLLSIMLIFFVPAAVGIMDTFFAYQDSMFKIIIIVIISTIVVLSMTAIVSQIVVKITNKTTKKEKIKYLEGECKR